VKNCQVISFISYNKIPHTR